VLQHDKICTYSVLLLGLILGGGEKLCGQYIPVLKL
jgi:hypothetical protein